jgi:N-acetyl-gamma-glutamylphosphate reductase
MKKETVLITSVIDNLVKASGQAVQNMNLMFGLESLQDCI